MNGGYGNTRRPEYWHPGQEYWVFVPNNQNGSIPHPSGLFPAETSLIIAERMSDPWSLFEETLIGGPSYDLARFPVAAAPTRPQIRPPLIRDYATYPRPRNSTRDTPTHISQPSRYNQISSQHESKSTQEEQRKGMNKLRKQLYSPHLSNIVKRLGTSTTKSTTSEAAQTRDDEFKRCSVCLEDFDTKQFLMVTPCNHMFHEECIVPWVKSQGKCPVCRFVIEEKNASLIGSGNVGGTTQGGIEMEWDRFFHVF